MLPGVITDVWDVVSPAKSLDEFDPVKTSYVEGNIINGIDISPDGQFVASSTIRTVNLWDILKLDKLYGRHVMNDVRGATIEKHEPYDNIVDLEFSSGGNYLLAGSSGKTSRFIYRTLVHMEGSYLTLYEMNTSKVIRIHEINTTFIEDTAISPDEKIYTTCTEMSANPERCTITFWDIESGEVVNSITSSNYKPTSITFTPDGKYLVSSFDNNINPDRIIFFDVDTGMVHKIIEESPVSDLQFSDNGNVFAAGSNDYGEVVIWDGLSYEELRRFKDLEFAPDSTALSPDGKFVMSMDWHRLIIWDIGSKKKIVSTKKQNVDFVDFFYAGTFSKDGKYIVIGLDASPGSEYIIKPHNGDSMVFIYDFEEIIETYYS